MSARQFRSPDTAALLAVLGKATELCRRLDLPKEAATFEGFIARFQRKPLIDEAWRDEVSNNINGISGLRIITRLGKDFSEFTRLQIAFSRVLFPGIETTRKPRARRRRKAIRRSETFWQLEGESDLFCATIPEPPKAGVVTTVRLTHSNSSGPLDEAEFFVRIGDPERPTAQDDFDVASDWVQARLVEELVFVDDQEMLRSEAQEPFKGGIPWDGTYDVQLLIPAGHHSIEIKILSRHPELLSSLILTGWNITVGD